MRKVPRKAYMNQKEFDEFIENLNNFGFDLSPDKISETHDNDFGVMVDEIEEIFYDLQFLDSIYSKILDLKNGFIEEPVYWQGNEITKLNLQEYKQKIESLIEEKSLCIDVKIVTFKLSLGLITSKYNDLIPQMKEEKL